MANRSNRFLSVVCWVAPLLLLPSAGPLQASEFYYMLVFGSQQIPPRARYSHTFATFVKATGEGPDVAGYRLESHTISWSPRTLDIRVCALQPECGQNLELHPTIGWVLSTGQRISLWGPYQIDRDLYDRAMQQIGLLQSGQVQYKAIDTGFPTDVASNCIHAVSSVTGGYRIRVISPSFGETASYYVTRRFCPWIIDCGRKHDWVSTRLGLDCYPLLRRELENPRSGLILGAARRAFGAEPAPSSATATWPPGLEGR
jgi:hypothetical protein